MSHWYTITDSDDNADVKIYDYIGGFGVRAKDFVDQLQKVKAKNINLHLNTAGGEVFDGMAIYNALRDHPAQITAHVDGIAASIGSVVAMGANKIRMKKGSMMMIHNPATFAVGDADDMRKQADVLDKIRNNIAQVYMDRTGLSKQKICSMMDDETWMDPEQAEENGFCDEIDDGDSEGVNNLSGMHVWNMAKVPGGLLKRINQTNQGRTDTPPRGEDGKRANPTRKDQQMNAEQFRAYAASNPDAAEVREIVNRGEQSGRTATISAERQRLTEIVNLFPGNPGQAVQSFLAGHDVPTAKAISESVKSAAAADAAKLEAANKEIEKLKAQIGTQGAVGTAGTAAENVKGADASQFKAKVDELVKGGMPRHKAVNQVATQFPEIYAAYLAKANTAKN